MSADTSRQIPRATARDWRDAQTRNDSSDHGTTCDGCGSRVDPAVARVMGGSVPVCKQCAESRSTAIGTTTAAVQRHHRNLYEGGFKG
jgi:ribosome-binding protein aMBF1 (putative translation factor)